MSGDDDAIMIHGKGYTLLVEPDRREVEMVFRGGMVRYTVHLDGTGKVVVGGERIMTHRLDSTKLWRVRRSTFSAALRQTAAILRQAAKRAAQPEPAQPQLNLPFGRTPSS